MCPSDTYTEYLRYKSQKHLDNTSLIARLNETHVYLSKTHVHILYITTEDDKEGEIARKRLKQIKIKTEKLPLCTTGSCYLSCCRA